MSYLRITDLSVQLGDGPRLLRGVSLSVEVGQVHALVGESGAGKSMIGKAVLGILPRAAQVVAGSIELDGVDLLQLPPAERRRLQFRARLTRRVMRSQLAQRTSSRCVVRRWTCSVRSQQ